MGSIDAEVQTHKHGNPQKTKLNENKNSQGKRPLSESDSENESTPTSSIHFPHFIVIESKDPSHPITKLSPFVVEKQLLGILGTPKSVKKLRNETILVECFTRQQSENLLKHKTFFQADVRIYPHKTLNSSKGIVRCKEMSLCSITEIKDNLKTQGVTDVKRISVRRHGEMRLTNTYILTFSSPTLPPSVKIGYMSVNVDLYIPNPLRCFKCQQYGHHISKCPRKAVCAKCGTEEDNHDYETCDRPVKCSNCKGAHAAFSRECPLWKEEKEILNLKYTKNLSFPEARQLIKQRKANQAPFSFPVRYADVTAPKKEDCHTCKILTALIFKKFPEMENELKEILPKGTLDSLSSKSNTSDPSSRSMTSAHPVKTSSSTLPTSKSASVTSSKPPSSTPNSKPKHSTPSDKSNQDASGTLSRPKTRIQIANEGLPSASTYTGKSNKSKEEEVFETCVSDSEVSKLIEPERSIPGKKKRSKARGRKITVKVGNPSISLSNKFDQLEETDDETNPQNSVDNEEKMEEESDGSDCDSPWARHRSDWNKDLDSWQVSTAETKIVKQT